MYHIFYVYLHKSTGSTKSNGCASRPWVYLMNKIVEEGYIVIIHNMQASINTLRLSEGSADRI